MNLSWKSPVLRYLFTIFDGKQPLNCKEIRHNQKVALHTNRLAELYVRVCPLKCGYGSIPMQINRPDLNAQL